MPPTTDDLAAAGEELRQAWLHGDADALEALIDDEATLAWPAALAGPTDAGKHDRLDSVRSGYLRVTAYDVLRERVRVLGELGRTDEIAALTWTTGHAAAADAAVTLTLRVTRTWRLSDHWRVISSHVVPAGSDRPKWP